MTSTEEKTLPRLKQRYREEIKDTLQKEFGYGNVMQIPGVVKVVVNMGVGDAARDAKLINGAVNDLATVAITQDNTNLYIAAELWVDPDPVSLPFGEVGIDFRRHQVLRRHVQHQRRCAGRVDR